MTTRHEPAGQFHTHLKSGVGALAGVAAVGGLATVTGLPLLIAPLGATAVILFGQPGSVYAQPVNVVVGYLLAAILGTAAALLAPASLTAAAVAVGLTLTLMLTFRVTHPPAGAVPLVAATSLAGSALIEAVLLGGVSLIALAMLVHRLPPRVAYPRSPEA